MAGGLQIGVVGPCAAGKTTLISSLKNRGYSARHIAQEHSYVPDMWLRISRPGILIYLDVSYMVSIKRRPTDMTAAEFTEQVQRLRHARTSADLYLHTDTMTKDAVLTQVIAFLSSLSR